MSPIGLDDIQLPSFATRPGRATLRLTRRALAAPGLLLSILILATSVLWAIAPSASPNFQRWMDGRSIGVLRQMRCIGSARMHSAAISSPASSTALRRHSRARRLPSP